MDYQTGRCYIDYSTDKIIWNAIDFTAHLKILSTIFMAHNILRTSLLHDTMMKYIV